MANSTVKDWAKKGFALTEGNNLKHVSTLTDKPAKVKKLHIDLMGRAMPENKPSEVTETGGKVYIKPISVNEAWKGKRFKSDAYKDYDYALSFLLPNNLVIPDGKLIITFEWGLSNDASDWDGPIKQTQDIIARRYRFDDKRITMGIVKNVIVPVGSEYVKFNISAL